MTENRERGNILFLILLAVILFAALSYAVTQSARGGGKSASDETLQSGAAAIMQYVTLLRNETQRLMLVNGCTAANLDWRDYVYKRYNGNPTTSSTNNNQAPPSPKAGCALFQGAGGSVAPQTFERFKDPAYEAWALANNTGFPQGGHAFIRWVNRKNELTDANEIAIYFTGLNMDLCRYMVSGDKSTALPTEAIDMTDANQAPTALTNIIDDPLNMGGEFFGSRNGSLASYCGLGAVILPQ